MTTDDESLRDPLHTDHLPLQMVPAPTIPMATNDNHVIRDRRRPLRDLAGEELQQMTDADKVSLVAYWASVAPAAFLLAREAFEHDTRW
jgi:hypothetical protein